MTLKFPNNFKKTAAVGLSAAAIIAVGLIQPFEGRVYKPYRDMGGVLTVCDGHTGVDIIENKTYTDAECDVLLKNDVTRIEVAVNKALKVPVPDLTRAAFISFTYNVGTRAFELSTLLQLANAGDLEGACDQLSRWVFVKGVMINGLINRRISERTLCMKGIDENYENWIGW